MYHRIAATLSVWAAHTRDALEQRIAEGRESPDRGDISITTVIIWVAAVGAAVAIAGVIAVIGTRYAGRLRNI